MTDTFTPKTTLQALAQIEAMISGAPRDTVNDHNAFDHFRAANHMLVDIRTIARAALSPQGEREAIATAKRIAELERILREVRRALDPECDPTRLPFKTLLSQINAALTSDKGAARREEPMNVTNSVRCALERHDAGHAWEVDSEDVAKLLAAYDRLTVPRSDAGSREALTECDWPAGRPFTFLDEPGEHDPCYVVMPCGAAITLNHHASEGVDIARAKFIIAACNAALGGEVERWKNVAKTEAAGRERMSQLAAERLPQCDVLTSDVIEAGAQGMVAYMASIEPDTTTKWVDATEDMRDEARAYARACLEASLSSRLPSAMPRCPNGLEHGNCGFPTCVPSCPGRLSLTSTHSQCEGK